MSGMSSENRHDEASVGRTTTSARSFTASATSSALIHGSASPLGMETTPTGRVRSASRRCAARSAASFGVAIRRGRVATLRGVGVLAAVVRSAHLSPDGAAPGPVAGVFGARGDRSSLGRLLDQVTVAVGIGNLDLHTKNLSLLHPLDAPPTLAPAYDVVPLRHHAHDGQMALAVDGESRHAALTVDLSLIHI